MNKERTSASMTAVRNSSYGTQAITQDTLLTFKETMNYLRVSRSTLYRIMWSGKLTGHKVGGTWRFYQSELTASVRVASAQSTVRGNNISGDEGQAKVLVAASY
jgi:excisionase family DNA binding protein